MNNIHGHDIISRIPPPPPPKNFSDSVRHSIYSAGHSGVLSKSVQNRNNSTVYLLCSNMKTGRNNFTNKLAAKTKSDISRNRLVLFSTIMGVRHSYAFILILSYLYIYIYTRYTRISARNRINL